MRCNRKTACFFNNNELKVSCMIQVVSSQIDIIQQSITLKQQKQFNRNQPKCVPIYGRFIYCFAKEAHHSECNSKKTRLPICFCVPSFRYWSDCHWNASMILNPVIHFACKCVYFCFHFCNHFKTYRLHQCLA